MGRGIIVKCRWERKCERCKERDRMRGEGKGDKGARVEGGTKVCREIGKAG